MVTTTVRADNPAAGGDDRKGGSPGFPKGHGRTRWVAVRIKEIAIFPAR